MLTRIFGPIKKYFQQESLADRGRRIISGALYCALAATVYVWASSLINVIVYQNLHLAVYWLGLLINWVQIALALALAGAIVGWFTEDYEGIVGGGIVLAVLIYVGNLVASSIGGRSTILMGQSLILTAIPLIGAGVLVALAIRMIIRRYVRSKQQEKPTLRRKQLVRLFGIVFLIGLVVGVFALFGQTSLATLKSMNQTLQGYATDDLIDKRFPYENLPSLKAHLGMDYSLYVHTSTLVTGTMDITIHFKDGYSVTCLVPQLEAGGQLLLDTCNEGMNVQGH